MPVRLRITFWFTVVVFVILGGVCGATYYFSYQARLNNIKTRLTNRAITTARLLSQSEIFDRQLVQRIDSLTTIAMKNKSVQGFNYENKTIYRYSDTPGDTIPVSEDILNEARVKESYYFKENGREVIAYHYTDANARIVVVCSAFDEEGLRNLSRLKTILLFGFSSGILIALIGGYIFSTRLLKPISRITQQVTDITAQNLTTRIPTGHSKDEWYKMASTLNDLLNRLQESFDLQRRFIANASHELSTPLTSISSQLEVALQRERVATDYEKIIASVLKDVKQMNKLTQTLLEFAKAAGNKGGLTISLVRIDEIIMELPGLLQKQNDQYEVALRFGELPENEEDLLVFGNADLLLTAIRNIVSNACKFSPDHKAIVGFVIDQKDFVITVSDNGPGIPSEELPHILQPFYRVDSTRSTPGFGLGLSLAHRFIKLHKGSLDILSEPGQGTIITLRLPSAKKS